MTSAAVADHYLVLVYPFLHKLRLGCGPQFGVDALPALGKRWAPWFNRLEGAPASGTGTPRATSTVSQLEDVLDDTYFFLPYVRDLLFPETGLPKLRGLDVPAQVGPAAEIGAMSLPALLHEYPVDAMVRMTLR